jgi:hypothetical protein
MSTAGFAVHEEFVLPDLLSDLLEGNRDADSAS